MKNTKGRLLTLALISLTALGLNSCTKDSSPDDPGSEFPREVTIVYTASSTTRTVAESVSYTNNSGGSTSLDNVTLPFTVTITRTVDVADFAALNALVVSPASESVMEDVKVEIRINGQVVDTETGTGSGSATADAFYLFE